LKLNEILYFEYIKRSRKAAIIMEDCRYECECTFENLVEELHPYDFAVNHRGCLINVRHIEKIQGFHIYLDNGKELSLLFCQRLWEMKRQNNGWSTIYR